ncbi:hypothetical protein KR018_000471 [Drosophila ironensis]|nr:hypothetical protein KR018_000471 [Drosophila ironensis]
MLKGSTLKILDVRILRSLIETRSAGKRKLHNRRRATRLKHWLKIDRVVWGFFGCLFRCRGHQHFTTHTFAINSPSRSYMTFNDLRNKNRLYTKKELVGYSMQDMYDVVSDVSNYHRFVPYVKRSDVHSQGVNGFKADLIVGFPPLNEAYTSLVTLKSPRLVRSECHDGRLFNYLLNEWRFSPGLKDIPDSCVLDFKVAFEFKSLLHSSLAHLFFDFICDQMESAFIQEVGRRSGPPSIRSHVLTSRRS